jgi:adenylate kinase
MQANQASGEAAAPSALQNRKRPGAIVFMGAPGAGKGTQAVLISKLLEIPHISTGDMFRESILNRTPLGLAAKAVMDAGGLVDDDIVNGMVRERLRRGDCDSGFLLDGYPRTVPQATALRTYIEERGLQEPVVVDLEVSYNSVVQRLCGRRVCPTCNRIYNLNSQPPAKDSICDVDGTSLQQRSDDREEAIRERMVAYQVQTAPLREFYRTTGRFVEIDANRAPEQITADLARLLRVS